MVVSKKVQEIKTPVKSKSKQPTTPIAIGGKRKSLSTLKSTPKKTPKKQPKPITDEEPEDSNEELDMEDDVEMEESDDETSIPDDNQEESDDEDIVPTQNKSGLKSRNTSSNPDKTRVFVRPVTSEESLKKFFMDHSLKAFDLSVPVGREGSKKKFGFASLGSVADANKAVSLSGSKIDGKDVEISIAQAKKEIQVPQKPSKILFVRNLPYEIDQDGLSSHFPGCESVRIPQNANGQSKGFAFVEFSDVQTAESFRKSNSDLEIMGRKIFISHGNAPRENNEKPKKMFKKKDNFKRGAKFQKRGGGGSFKKRNTN